ncbi:MAG: peptidoglycan DD-metalloendopeptidase family protein [Proteobacteria bacterium]|nr:peptidoglycan DD-metalloendopeptidase family protein [Pseudomonadota bacterium]
MTGKLRTGYLILLLSLIIGPADAAPGAPNAEALKKQIEAMEAEIEAYQRMLRKTEGERAKLENDLEDAEKGINHIQKQIIDIEQTIESGEDKVDQLRSEQSMLETRKKEQTGRIEEQIIAAYKLGRQESLKVVLNQEDLNEISRMLTYYDYVNRARVQEVERFVATIDRLEAVTAGIEQENALLITQRTELVEQRSQLADQNRNRQRVLGELQRKLAETGGEIEKLQADRTRLEGLLERIISATERIAVPADGPPFSAMKGELLLPVQGSISQRFGAARNAGKMRWRGVLIDAPAGTPVYAVHHGQIVFADWLRGFGLLVIINHGQGYMSLYGHNQMIYRETGDWVVTGENIATVGDTGGQNETGLYFEIRIDGNPANPQLWCRARGSNAA